MFASRHKHAVQEQIYRVLESEGLMEIAGKNHVVRKHDFILLPPGVEHAISNSGLVDLVFLVITSPVMDDERSPPEPLLRAKKANRARRSFRRARCFDNPMGLFDHQRQIVRPQR
jgi:uncharacterized cupin superfamily protein